jgi:hypothetical protein
LNAAEILVEVNSASAFVWCRAARPGPQPPRWRALALALG